MKKLQESHNYQQMSAHRLGFLRSSKYKYYAPAEPLDSTCVVRRKAAINLYSAFGELRHIASHENVVNMCRLESRRRCLASLVSVELHS